MVNHLVPTGIPETRSLDRARTPAFQVALRRVSRWWSAGEPLFWVRGRVQVGLRNCLECQRQVVVAWSSRPRVAPCGFGDGPEGGEGRRVKRWVAVGAAGSAGGAARIGHRAAADGDRSGAGGRPTRMRLGPGANAA